MRQSLMKMACPAQAQTRFFTIEKTCAIINKASASQHIAIICETPEDVLALVEGGVPIKSVNIGNMHMSEGKRQVATSVAVDDTDVAAFKRLQELGVELYIQRTPSIAKEDINKLFKKFLKGKKHGSNSNSIIGYCNIRFCNRPILTYRSSLPSYGCLSYHRPYLR